MKKPNPRPAGAGYVIRMQSGERLRTSKPLGVRTNNEAEYLAVLHALTTAADQGATEAHVRSDSRVVVGQLEWGWKCNYEHLRLLQAAVAEQIARCPRGVTFERIPRTENIEADALARAGALASRAREAVAGEGEHVGESRIHQK